MPLPNGDYAASPGCTVQYPGRQTPIKDATMRKIVAGLAISLGGVAESPAGW
jgi:hypothetical protein